MRYRVVIEQDEDGWFVVTCPALPGCVSQGQSRAEALENMKDAVRLFVGSLRKHGDPVPSPSTDEEIIEVAMA